MGVYFNLGFQMQDTDELSVTPPLSPSYEERTAVYTGRFLCQICFSGCLKKNVKREKLEKISNIEHFKETALCWKNFSYEYKRVHALVDWEKGGKWRIKPAKEHSLRKFSCFKRERNCNCSKYF